MTRHLLRLIWNRKRQNFLLTVEIFFAFLTVFGVVLLGLQYANNTRQSLGFSIDRVWNIDVDRKEAARDPEVKARHRETFAQLMQALAEMPQIEAVAAGFTAPYTSSRWGSGLRLAGGRNLPYSRNEVTDGYRDVFGMAVAEGRWFSREDDAAGWIPVVVNRRLARAIFEDGEAVGRIIPEEPSSAAETEVRVPRRVIGVVEDFKQHGELSSADSYMFNRMRIATQDSDAALPFSLFIRLTPGTTAQFEEAVVKRVMAVAPTWSFEVRPVEDLRSDKLQEFTTPLVIVATIATFLLLMVALGLTGVVWQSVTQRTREFGLRRANGATITDVRVQVLAEVALMTTLALAAGVVLVAQLPLLPLPPDIRVIPAGVFIASIGVSAAAIYCLTLACGWQPSRLATRVQPAEALHYE